MRVLMLSWEYPPHMVGGLGRHVMSIAPALVRVGVELHIATPRISGGEAYEIIDGVHVHRLDVPPDQYDSLVDFNLEVNRSLAATAQQRWRGRADFDLLHTHDWLSAEAALTLKHAWRLPLLATIHATERGRGQGYVWTLQSEQINSIEWKLAYEGWRVVVCSEFMSQQIQQYFDAPADKLDVVPNGVTMLNNPFAHSADRIVFRRRYAADDAPLAMYVGRMVYEKGLHVLLDAWVAVLAVNPRARLLLAGTGPQLDRLKALAWELGIAESVIFTGFISDEERNGIYFSADLAVFPSLYEPFGMVALEAMAARCPVVVSETGGLGEVVRQDETGILVRSGDAQSLAEGILHTLEHADLTARRVENAFREARDQYNWQRIAELTRDIYNGIYTDWHASAWGASIGDDVVTS